MILQGVIYVSVIQPFSCSGLSNAMPSSELWMGEGVCRVSTSDYYPFPRKCVYGIAKQNMDLQFGLDPNLLQLTIMPSIFWDLIYACTVGDRFVNTIGV